MPPAAQAVLFFVAAAVSLATSWLLVSRLERIGERLGLSEALLGVLAALAADAPEITAAVTALIRGQHGIGAGVVIGSNVFNLAALLGLSAVVAGMIRFDRKVVALGGVVVTWSAVICLTTVVGGNGPVIGAVLALAVVAGYVVVLGLGPRRLDRPEAPAWSRWLGRAVAEEEAELEVAIRPTRAGWLDVVVAAVALVVVVVASVTMERAASSLGAHYKVAEIVIGGLVLAAVTSLPNAVAAVYLARRGRGAATLATALMSNALNVTLGLLLPAAIVGLGPPSTPTTLVAAWNLGLTVVVLAVAYRAQGLGRAAGALIIGAYLVFVGAVVASVPH